jgi:hypothetical protein
MRIKIRRDGAAVPAVILLVGEGLDPPGGMIFRAAQIFGKLAQTKISVILSGAKGHRRMTMLIDFYVSTFH